MHNYINVLGVVKYFDKYMLVSFHFNVSCEWPIYMNQYARYPDFLVQLIIFKDRWFVYTMEARTVTWIREEAKLGYACCPITFTLLWIKFCIKIFFLNKNNRNTTEPRKTSGSDMFTDWNLEDSKCNELYLPAFSFHLKYQLPFYDKYENHEYLN